MKTCTYKLGELSLVTIEHIDVHITSDAMNFSCW